MKKLEETNKTFFEMSNERVCTVIKLQNQLSCSFTFINPMHHFSTEKAAINTRIKMQGSENFNMTSSSAPQKNVCFVWDPLPLKIVRICAYCLVIVVSLAGNFLIITVTWKTKITNSWKSIHYLIVKMALADIFLTLYMPRVISMVYAGLKWQVDGIAGEIFCRTSTLLNQTCTAASILTVVAITLDRFLAVMFPLRLGIFTVRRTRLTIIFIWLSAFVFRVPMVLAASLNDKQHCFIQLDETFGQGTEKIYYLLNLICLFASPFLTILILYSAILVTLKRQKLTKNDGVLKNAWHQRKEQTARKVLQMATAVVVAFVMCWFLYFIRLILYSYQIEIPCNVLFIRLFLVHSNSAINPCLYVAFSENYRRGVKKILSQMCCLQVCFTSSYSFPHVPKNGKCNVIFHERQFHHGCGENEFSTKL